MTTKCGKANDWEMRRCRVCHQCSFSILVSSVVYYLRDPRQHRITLFYMMKILLRMVNDDSLMY